jgi:uncharacterized protein YdeI (BOF family)
MKKVLAAGLALALSVSLFSFAPTAYAASPAKPSIEDIEYKSNGRVEVDFWGKVSYKNAKVTVKDSSGKSYSAKIIDRDNDELDFRVNKIAAGKTYTFKISGIKARGANKYQTITGKFKTPKAASVTIKEVEYDADDRELSVEFKQRVKYKNAKSTVKDSSGKVYSSRIVEKDSDDLEIRVSGLKYGKKYTVSISGVSNRDANKYLTVSKTFYAWDD